MLTPADLLRLPCTPDLLEGGIAYALQNIPHSVASYDQIRRIVANTAVEIAFRRYLANQNIPFEVQASLPMSEHNRRDVILNRQRCDIKSFFISYQTQIAAMRRDPNIILNAPALVLADVDAGEGHYDSDLYIFAFVTGLKSAPRDIPKLAASKQPHFFTHIPPQTWREPARWNPLGNLILKSESNANVQVEISGRDSSRGFISQTINLMPRRRTILKHSFYSISSIHLRGIPSARIGLRMEQAASPYIIPPEKWENLWIYGMEIVLAGFLTRREFRQRAKYLPPGMKTFQYRRTRVKNLFVPVSSLRPMRALFERMKKREVLLC